MTRSLVENVAIIGGTGQVGSRILDALVQTRRFTITAVSRGDSTASFPADVKVVRGDYEDEEFFVKAFSGQDALIITLNFTAPQALQSRMISAAAKAGVSWIIPNEFGSDNGNPRMRDDIPINATKTQYRDLVEQLGKSSWIGVVNNPWFDYSLPGGYFGINIKDRVATLYDDGVAKFNTTTLKTVGRAVAAVLSLPVTESNADKPSLSKYRNQFLYISSFRVSQRDLLDAVEKVTDTKDSDWKIEKKSAQAFIDEGYERIQKGDFYGTANILYGSHFKEGFGGDFSSAKGTANAVLGLPEEDLVEETRNAVASLQ